MSRAGRPRVLISAYHCAPGHGPEAGAGWAFARAAAVDHDVWVITRPVHREALEDALAADRQTSAHLRVRYHDLPAALVRRKRRPIDLYWFYALWQHRLVDVAAALHAEHGFDVAHHVTFANDWLPCGPARVDIPLVWGPVGGATRTPWPLLRWLPPRDLAVDAVRGVVGEVCRRALTAEVARAAAVVVAQNPDVAARFANARHLVVEPNAVVEDDAEEPSAARTGVRPRTALFVGRLVPWKGPQLAIATLADGRLAGWRLDLYGEGPYEHALRTQAQRAGVADRVTFHGHRPRAEVMQACRLAAVMLFPSMHDSAGWAVGEASTVGCPVVCLDVGGPPVLAADNAFPVRPGRNPVPALAEAVLRASAVGGRGHRRWSAQRLPALVGTWYAEAMSTAPTDEPPHSS